MNISIQTLSLLGIGWLGLPLAEHFIGLGYQVNASTRSTERLSELAATGIQPFIVDIDQLDQMNNDQAEFTDSSLYKIEQLFTGNPRFSTTILRFSGLIGYQRHPGRFFRQGKVVSQADAPVNLIHRDDCIGIIDAIIEQQAWGEVFNGCADTHPSKRKFYTYARQLLDMPAPEFAGETQQAFKIVSNVKVKQLLDYQFKYPDVMNTDFG